MKNKYSPTTAPPKSVITLRTRNRSLQVTREGAGFIFVILCVGVGAVFTGHNLLYLVLAMCCSLLVISGILSELMLKHIIVTYSLPATLYANDFFHCAVTVANRKKYFSSYSLRISIIPAKETWLEENSGIYIFQVPPKCREEKTLLMKTRKRGRLSLLGIQVSTGFPFGFFYKTKYLQEKIEATVFPSIHPVPLPQLSHPSPEGQGIVMHQGEEVHSTKEYREGDPLKAVHWKSSARTGNLRVKEQLASGEQSFTIFLGIKDPQTNRQVSSSLLEERVSEAASLAYNLIRRGDEVSLKMEDHPQTPFGNSERHLENLMRFLAFVGLQQTND